MLSELSIRNFALIDELTIAFDKGLCVLTGETGAGKSIIIDAIVGVLGDRLPTEFIRTGESDARIEAVFEAGECRRAQEALAAAGIEPEADGTVILTRQVSRRGRGRCWINGRPVTLTVLRAVGEHLVDVHGQHEHQSLIHEQTHLEFLDGFGGPAHQSLREEFAELFDRREAVRTELERLRADEREKYQRLDMLRFQVEEIDRAGLSVGEEEALKAERRRLANAERLQELASQARELLSGDSEGTASAAEALALAEQRLTELVSLDPEVRGLAEALSAAVAAVSETARELSEYVETIEFDPVRLEEVEARLDEIARLKRKYGDTIEDVLRLRDEAAEAIEAAESSEERVEELQEQLRALTERAGAVATKLSTARQRLANRLAKTVESELGLLGMPKARFRVAIERAEDESGIPGDDGRRYAATRRGTDRVRFEMTANPGEALRPLARIASGGELSRLMLAFKSICSRAGEIPTLIFDEVDAGIGADTARAVGEKLVDVSSKAQVLCVTHFPQIARMADLHVRVDKQVRAGRSFVRARVVESEERLREIARMLGGVGAAQAVQEHAAALLASAEKEKARIRRPAVV
ncbi:MAG: DNA repair protein RecN [Armatimonadota bacterium]